MATISAREFNRDVSAAKRQARIEPVFITDRGEPSYVLISVEEYRRLKGEDGLGLADVLQMSEEDYVEVDFPRFDDVPREVTW